MMHKYPSLKGTELRWRADVANLHGLIGAHEKEAKSKEVESQATEDSCLRNCTLGQERGVAAFRFGMAMRGRGYNIFVTGPSVADGARGGVGGVARIDTLGIVKSLLKQGIKEGGTTMTKHVAIPPDLCYVHNFSRPDEPSLLRFKAGTAKAFKEDMRLFVKNLMAEVPQLFENPEYTAKKNQIVEEHERKTRDFFKKLEARVRESGFAVINMQVGGVQRPDIAPLIDGEPVVMLKLEELQEKGRFPKVELEELRATYAKLKDEIDAIFLDVRDVQRDVKRKVLAMDTAIFQKSARELAHDLLTKYDDEKVQGFVDAMLGHMAENIEILRKIALEGEHDTRGNQEGQKAESKEPKPQKTTPKTVQNNAFLHNFLHVYGVNILVDNSKLTGPPVIIESYPTYRNLFGSIERTLEQNTGQNAGKNTGQSDYRKIHAGSFIKANGGYLVLNLMDAMMEAGVWQTLKRALKNEAMEIQTFDPYYFILAPSIKPEAIEMHVKVVVLATPQLYHLLRHHDDDVARVFKVWADFDASMNKDDAALQHVCQCMQGIVHEAGLLPFDASAVATLLELGVRFAGRREKISIAFPQLRDIMEEANYMAILGGKEGRDTEGQEGGQQGGQQEAKQVTAGHVTSEHVTSEHVMAAIEARRHRAGQVEEKMQEMIDRGSILIDTKGLSVGQVNGLAVLSMGNHLFGKPSRITATTAMGKAGIVNIEREAELSGALHTKGLLILTGYVNRMFGQKRPLILSASIAFEQSYGGVDGDSASSTEVYALLSSLSCVPIKQGIAVTGSVNQKGEVQAIGGVNEKIEGFYDCCVQAGLTGEQGVIIPHANKQDLMLDVRVVEAVDRGEFHVWAVKNISEGIEILTGMESGILQNFEDWDEVGAEDEAEDDENAAGHDVYDNGGYDICDRDGHDVYRNGGYNGGHNVYQSAGHDLYHNGHGPYAVGSIFAKVDARLDEMARAFCERRLFSACKLE